MDVLRQGWPAAVLEGRYIVQVRLPRAGWFRNTLDFVDVMDTPDWIQEVVVDGHAVLESRDRRSLRTIRQPRTVVLQLRARRASRQPRKPLWQAVKDFVWGDHVHDVMDVRLGTYVGAVVVRSGRPPRDTWQLLDPDGRAVASVSMTGGQSLVLDPTGTPLARMSRNPVPRGRGLVVDVSGLAARVDPRLILASTLMML